MRIWTLSDLHDDHNSKLVGAYDLPDDVEADVLVIPGDIDGRFSRAGLRWLERQRQRIDLPMIVLPGNHCHWRGSVDLEVGRFHDRMRSDGIHVLDGDSVVIGGTRFVGGTLWTDYRVYHDDREAAAEAAVRYMNDFKYVRAGSYAFRLRPTHLAAEHDRHRSAIEQTLRTPFDGPSVVVTHHAPSPRSLNSGKATEALDGAYASDLEYLIRQLEPDLWLHGHTHAIQDYVIGRTRVVCNPRGYYSKIGVGRHARIKPEHKGFDERLVVEVGVGQRPVEVVKAVIEKPPRREPSADIGLLLQDWPSVDYVPPAEEDEAEIDLGAWKP